MKLKDINFKLLKTFICLNQTTLQMFKCFHVNVSVLIYEVIEVSYLLYKDFYDGKVICNFYRTSTNFYPSRDQTYYSMHFTVKKLFPIFEFF